MRERQQESMHVGGREREREKEKDTCDRRHKETYNHCQKRPTYVNREKDTCERRHTASSQHISKETYNHYQKRPTHVKREKRHLREEGGGSHSSEKCFYEILVAAVEIHDQTGACRDQNRTASPA